MADKFILQSRKLNKRGGPNKTEGEGGGKFFEKK